MPPHTRSLSALELKKAYDCASAEAQAEFCDWLMNTPGTPVEIQLRQCLKFSRELMDQTKASFSQFMRECVEHAKSRRKLSRKAKERSEAQRQLEEQGLTDPEIAKSLHVGLDAVRRLRSREGRKKLPPRGSANQDT
jgi:hypothetical protein